MIRCRRPAFTLIETVIAMSLLTLLMAITWTMFGVYTKLEAKGVARAEEAGLVRALDRQFRHDLLHVMGIDPLRPVVIDDIDQPQPQPNPLPVNGYLVGTATDLHFVISPPRTSGDAALERVISYQPRRMLDDESDDSISTGSDREESQQATTEVLELAVADQYATPLGIDRRDHSWRGFWEDRELNDAADDLAGSSRPIALDADDFIQIGGPLDDDDSVSDRLPELEETTDPIPEISRLRFRYFDGHGWTSQWNSTANGRLPLAIEVGFDLEMRATERSRSADDETSDRLDSSRPENPAVMRDLAADRDTIDVGDPNDGVDVADTEYRFVVSVPSAKVPKSVDPDSDPAWGPDGSQEWDQPSTQRGLP